MSQYTKTVPVGAIPCKGTWLEHDYPDRETMERVCRWVLKNVRSQLTFSEENCAERYVAGSNSDHVRDTVKTLCHQYDHQAR